MDKRIIKKSICLVTVWVFLLSQLAYASLYEDILSLPSSQDMPTWDSSSSWRNSKVEPLYDPQQIEPILPLSNDEEGDSDGIGGWFRKHIIEPVVNFFRDESTQSTAKTVLETGLKIVLAPLLLFTACTAPPQVTPTPTPTPVSETPIPLTPTPTHIPATPTPIPEAQIKEWIADLGSNDYRVQNSAAENLIKSESQTVDPMLKALTDKKQTLEVQLGIALVFGEMARQGGLNDEIKRKVVVESLIPLLWADSLLLRWQAYNALKNMGGPQAEEAIRKARSDDNWLLNPALEQIKSPDPEKRAIAALCLGTTGDPRAVEPLITALKDEDFGVRMQAVYALGEIGDSRAVEPLKEMIPKAENDWVRQQIDEALKKIRQK